MDVTKAIDYTCLSTYLTCPRKFYFRHVLNLSPDSGGNVDLIFGLAWHEAMAAGYALLATSTPTPKDLTIESSKAFMRCWEKEDGSQFNYDSIFPKNPAHAVDMLMEYWTRFAQIDATYQHLGSEIPFTIVLGNGLPNYIGRVDHLMQHKTTLQKIILEHKTAKYLNDIWLLGFEMSFQCLGYLTWLKITEDTIPMIWVNGALCQKSKIDFHRHQIRRADIECDRFLYDITRHIKALLYELAMLEEIRNDLGEDLLTSKTFIFDLFPRNTVLACTSYFRPCPYMDLCNSFPNPERFRIRPPLGYKTEVWNPHHPAVIDK